MEKKYLRIYLFIIILLVAAFLVRYFIFSGHKLNKETNTVSSTTILAYVPQKLPSKFVEGYCWTNSVAAPYRKDAWRCFIENDIHDPCFSTDQKGKVVCDVNPINEKADVGINLTKPLPKTTISDEEKKNWGWFVELEDTTYCMPFTGTRIMIQDKVGYYGCNSVNPDEQIILLGELNNEKNIWTIDKATIIKDGGNYKIKSVKNVAVKSVWQ